MDPPPFSLEPEDMFQHGSPTSIHSLEGCSERSPSSASERLEGPIRRTYIAQVYYYDYHGEASNNGIPFHEHSSIKEGQYSLIHTITRGETYGMWLARDNHKERNVAIKIFGPTSEQTAIDERTILEAIEERGEKAHPGRDHVPRLIEPFVISNEVPEDPDPNGPYYYEHHCLVFDILGPSPATLSRHTKDGRLNGELSRSVSRQLLLALDYIHGAGVVHANILVDNILFWHPEQEQAFIKDAKDELASQDVSDNVVLAEECPKKLVKDSLRACNSHCNIQLIDFSGGFSIGETRALLPWHSGAHHPEAVLARPATSAMDMWDVGFTIYELFTGTELLDGWSRWELISQLVRVIGQPPKEWIEQACKEGLEECPKGKLVASHVKPLEEELERSYFKGHFQRHGKRVEDDNYSWQDIKGKTDLGAEEIKMLASFLRKLLVIDPDERWKPSDLINEPWVNPDNQGTSKVRATPHS